MNDMRKYINIVEYAENDSRVQWQDIENWDEMHDKYKNRLMNAFEDCHEMLDLVSAGNAEDVGVQYRSNQYLQGTPVIWFGYGSRSSAIMNLNMYYMLYHNIIEYNNIDSNFVNLSDSLKLLRGLIKFCQKLKIKAIKIDAVIDGAYQWARLGFLPKKVDDNFYNNLRGNVISIYKENIITKEEHDKYIQIIEKRIPEVIWELSDQPHGSDLLAYYSWDGELDFTNPKCLERLRRFVRI